MTSPVLRSSLAALACAAALAFASPTLAASINFNADLKASEEVPPNASKGTGQVSAVFDTNSKVLTWKGVYSGLSGDATAAHFHTGEVGKNGGVAVPIAPISPSFGGTATLTDAQIADMMAGKWYVNIHTAANKGGEIRGQFTKK